MLSFTFVSCLGVLSPLGSVRVCRSVVESVMSFIIVFPFVF